MRKNVLLLGAMMMASMSLMAQTKGGGISQSALQQMEKSQQSGIANKALFNAIANNNIDDLVKNHANEAPVDTDFSIETPSQSIHNQKSSGRCWMFSGFNVLRSNFAVNDKQGRVVEYSQDYLFFYDQLEKANLMLQGVIDLGKKSIEDPQVQFFFKNPLNDGGTFCGVADLASKYGLVPMSAQPETYSSNNTSKMSRLSKQQAPRVWSGTPQNGGSGQEVGSYPGSQERDARSGLSHAESYSRRTGKGIYLCFPRQGRQADWRGKEVYS